MNIARNIGGPGLEISQDTTFTLRPDEKMVIFAEGEMVAWRSARFPETVWVTDLLNSPLHGREDFPLTYSYAIRGAVDEKVRGNRRWPI